jgi:hypothetical protein
MSIEARKIRLIEGVLKVDSEKILVELENVLQRSRKAVVKNKKVSIYDFVGILSKKEADQMRKAVTQ